MPLFAPPFPKDDDELKNSATVRGDRYGLRGALYPGQDKHIQFEEQDDGAHDWLTSQHNQKRTPSLPRP